MGKPKHRFNNKSARKAQERFFQRQFEQDREEYFSYNRETKKERRARRKRESRQLLYHTFMTLLTTNNEGIITSEWFEKQ